MLSTLACRLRPSSSASSSWRRLSRSSPRLPAVVGADASTVDAGASAPPSDSCGDMDAGSCARAAATSSASASTSTSGTGGGSHSASAPASVPPLSRNEPRGSGGLRSKAAASSAAATASIRRSSDFASVVSISRSSGLAVSPVGDAALLHGHTCLDRWDGAGLASTTSPSRSSPTSDTRKKQRPMPPSCGHTKTSSDVLLFPSARIFFFSVSRVSSVRSMTTWPHVTSGTSAGGSPRANKRSMLAFPCSLSCSTAVGLLVV